MTLSVRRDGLAHGALPVRRADEPMVHEHPPRKDRVMAPRLPRGRAQSPPSQISPQSLERAAHFHLERRTLTEAQLRRSLERKVQRAEHHHGVCPDAARWIDELIARFRSSGLLNDARVAAGRVLGLRGRGNSQRAVLMKLRHAGVDTTTAAHALAEIDGIAGEDAELQAACAYVRRRKLGTKDRHRALAALARQGFSFEHARRALDACASQNDH